MIQYALSSEECGEGIKRLFAKSESTLRNDLKDSWEKASGKTENGVVTSTQVEKCIIEIKKVRENKLKKEKGGTFFLLNKTFDEVDQTLKYEAKKQSGMRDKLRKCLRDIDDDLFRLKESIKNRSLSQFQTDPLVQDFKVSWIAKGKGKKKSSAGKLEKLKIPKDLDSDINAIKKDIGDLGKKELISIKKQYDNAVAGLKDGDEALRLESAEKCKELLGILKMGRSGIRRRIQEDKELNKDYKREVERLRGVLRIIIKTKGDGKEVKTITF
jgi:hypothetical protein